MVTIGLGTADGRDDFPGVPFRALAGVDELDALDGTVVFVTDFPVVALERDRLPVPARPTAAAVPATADA